MVRDYYITEDAYAKNYDQSSLVVQNVNMWQDHLKAIYQKYTFLQLSNIAEDNPLKVIEEHLNPYVDSLQVHYSEKVGINIKAFENIATYWLL